MAYIITQHTKIFEDAINDLSNEVHDSEFDYLTENISVYVVDNTRVMHGSYEVFTVLFRYIGLGDDKHGDKLHNPFAAAKRLMRQHGVKISGGVLDGGTLLIEGPEMPDNGADT